MSADLKQRQEKWVAVMRRARKPLTAWVCPGCNAEVHCALPPRGEGPWDTLTTCPDCESLFWKVVYADGSVEISRPPVVEGAA